jgi:hypothetical protein
MGTEELPDNLLVPGDDEETIERILVKLIEGGDDIAMKTDMPRPMNVVRLSTLADWLQQEGFLDSATLIRDFVDYYMHYMVSNQRKGRKEIIRALSDRLKNEEKSRWTGRSTEEMGPG